MKETMKRTTLALLCALVFAGCPSPPVPDRPEDNSRLLEHVLDSTVIVGGDIDGGGPQLWCTGVLHRGVVLTAAHCVLEGILPEVQHRSDGGSWYPADAVYVDPYEDLAVLRPRHIFEDGLRVREHDPVYGERILCVGHPSGLRWTATHGIVSFPRREGGGVTGEQTWVQIDCRIDPGNSGGPVLDRHGNIIGIVSFGIRHSYGAVHTSVLRDAIDSVLVGRN